MISRGIAFAGVNAAFSGVAARRMAQTNRNILRIELILLIKDKREVFNVTLLE
jgi:hypothetical protein